MAWTETTQAQYMRCFGVAHAEDETDVTDAEWALVEGFLPPPSKMRRPRKTDLHAVFNAVQFLLGTGCQWRSIPRVFPPFTTVQNYFYTWRDSGVLGRVAVPFRAAMTCKHRRSKCRRRTHPCSARSS